MTTLTDAALSMIILSNPHLQYSKRNNNNNNTNKQCSNDSKYNNKRGYWARLDLGDIFPKPCRKHNVYLNCGVKKREYTIARPSVYKYVSINSKPKVRYNKKATEYYLPAASTPTQQLHAGNQTLVHNIIINNNSNNNNNNSTNTNIDNSFNTRNIHKNVFSGIDSNKDEEELIVSLLSFLFKNKSTN